MGGSSGRVLHVVVQDTTIVGAVHAVVAVMVQAKNDIKMKKMKRLLKLFKRMFCVPHEYVMMTLNPNGKGIQMVYSSNEAFYKHFKRQFDAANELAELQRQGKLPK